MPVGSLLGLGLGAAQSIIGGINARKAQKKLEQMQSPSYSRNKGILDYYDKALQRYQTSPYETSGYKKQMQDIGRNVSQGISALTDRGQSIGGISRLIAGANDATLNANVAAENQQNQRFNQLGSATEMQAGEDRLAYQYNQLAPFERKYNLLAMKAAGNNATTNAGISNMFNSLNTMGDYNMLKKLYSNNDSYGDSGYGDIMRTRIPIEKQIPLTR